MSNQAADIPTKQPNILQKRGPNRAAFLSLSKTYPNALFLV